MPKHNQQHLVLKDNEKILIGDNPSNRGEIYNNGSGIVTVGIPTDEDITTISGSLQSQIDDKADIGHDHSGVYQPAGDYVTEAEFTVYSGTLQDQIDGKSDTSHDHDATYAPIAEGVTNGDSHDHSGGDGAQISYSNLGDVPSTFSPASHNNSAHSETYITSAGVTYEALSSNGDIGSSASTLCAGDDSRLSDARTPTTHSHDKIEEGNSSVEVVDTGTGSIAFVVDGTTVMTISATGISLGSGMQLSIATDGELLIPTTSGTNNRSLWINS